MPGMDRWPESLRSALVAVAECALPAGKLLPAGGEVTVRRLESALEHAPAPVRVAVGALAGLAQLQALRVGRKSLDAVPATRRLALLETWRTSPSSHQRNAFRALMVALKGAHYADPAIVERCGRRPLPGPVVEKPPRWMSQVVDLAQPGADESIEADVVIVGSGAGGAAAARTLASRGLAVVILEAGKFLGRNDYAGSVLVRSAAIYASLGLQYTVGNASIFLPTGEAVGGTTTINAGTCLRTPPWILRHWREEQGLDFGPQDLDPYFERVESWLEVGVPDAKLLGVPATVIAQGAERVGIAHGPLMRNAPGCDGQAACCFGCPTGAKRSADIAMIPAALQSGAMLFTHARVHEVRTEGRETVVHARSAEGRSVSVRARSLVMAAGALRTPSLLRAAGLRHPMLGRQLTIHPAVGALGVFPFHVGMDACVPQGYGLEGLRQQGLLFETAGLPFEVTAISLHAIGPRYVEWLEQYPHMLAFGFNVRDTSRGRVLGHVRGLPLVRYDVGAADMTQFSFGLRVLFDVLFQGGAHTVLPGIYGMDEVAARQGSRILDARSLAASDLDLSAYHPMGTARMGVDPATSVVDEVGRVRGAKEWVVCDGSVVPSSIGANPQMTIMALAIRAAEALADRLDE